MSADETPSLLALNCGSSSIKFALFTLGLAKTSHGLIEAIGGRETPRLKVAGEETRPFGERGQGHADLLPRLIEEVIVPRGGSITGVGHRVVHGGEDFDAPARIDPATRQAIALLSPLAPAHQPHNLSGIDAISEKLPGVTQIACFDTAFHATVPSIRREMPLPRAYARDGLLRYGFHGLSYQHVSATLPSLGLAGGRVIACHLGNGASICGMIDGRSSWTSMGFTPLDGLMMGQRPGRLDPGAVLWLIEQHGGDAGAVNRLLNSNSGLAGVSGISGDMRVLMQSSTDDARFALEMYVDRLVEEIGAAAAAINGCDGLVFSGGVGENANAIRAMAVERLEWLGFELDPDANLASAQCITRGGSRPNAFIVKADEELVIARATAEQVAA
ncbi:MAG: acetate/propionate family kinase [Hoeflea sp.]|uniref:acetate/propionate family kinase n=1 Tax=Hoeflea sp. TaxID=1940281 RepID=UPI0032ED41DE